MCETATLPALLAIAVPIPVSESTSNRFVSLVDHEPLLVEEVTGVQRHTTSPVTKWSYIK